MSKVNICLIEGNLVKDPVVRDAGSTRVANFTIGYNEKFKKGDGYEERSHFFDVTAFGAAADQAEKWLQRGDSVMIEGSIAQDKWEKDGEKRSKVGVKAMRIHFMRVKKYESKAKSSAEEAPF